MSKHPFERNALIGRYTLDDAAREHARISFAQQGEDMILRRLLDRTLKRRPDEKGTYVDIGAFHHSSHSVTRFLYDAGWRGLVADIGSDSVAGLREHRPRDITVRAGISDSDGEIEAFLFSGTNLLNTCDRETADRISSWAGEPTRETLPKRKLDTLLAEHGFDSVDVLNIDVEGLEMQVLRGLTLETTKPGIICVEMHVSNVAEVLESEIYQHLSAHGYKFIASAVITQFFARQ